MLSTVNNLLKTVPPYRLIFADDRNFARANLKTYTCFQHINS